MRVLHIVDSTGVYGKERVILELMEQQAHAGLFPILGSITRTAGPTSDKPLLRAARERGLEGVGLVVRGPGDPWRVRRAVAEQQIALVHTHDYKGSLILAPLRRCGLVPPLVRTLHRVFIHGFSKLRAYETLDRWCLRWHDAVAVVTADIRAQTSLDVTVIHNGISPPAAARADLQDPDLPVARMFCEGALVLGALARLSPEKNLGALLEAVATLEQQGVAARLIILGEGRSRPALEAHARRLGIADRVWLPGFKPAVQSWLQMFDFYLQPSFAEGLPISLLEAMHAGVPLLVTPVAGMNEILAAGAAIEIPFEGSAIADVIRAHWKTREARTRARAIAEIAKQLVRTRYGSERMASEYAALYRRVLKPASQV
jgi:glycosyltransferase involved in cell wall biosynthesis